MNVTPHRGTGPIAQSDVRPEPIVIPSQAAHSMIVTLIEPALRSRVSAAGEGAFTALHVERLSEAVRAARDRRVRGVLLSPSFVNREQLPLVARLTREFAGLVAIARTAGREHEDQQQLLLLGACGIQCIIDLTIRDGWNRLRSLSVDAYADIREELRAAIIPALGSATVEATRFFETLLRDAPGVSTARSLARILGTNPSTLMSRFFRVGLPSPKRYLAATRLLYASSLLEVRELSIAEVANRLDYSSSQSFGRHIKAMFRMTASDFRWRYSFERTREDYTARLIVPFQSTLRSFHPLGHAPARNRPASMRDHGEEMAAASA